MAGVSVSRFSKFTTERKARNLNRSRVCRKSFKSPSNGDQHISSSHHSTLPPQRTPQQILDARAAALAEPLGDQPASSKLLEILLFSVGSERFAIETEYVTEVIRDVSVTPLPCLTSDILGVTNLRGEVLAVASLTQVFSLPEPVNSGHVCRWVIVTGQEYPQLGIAASEVAEVAAVPLESMSEATLSCAAVDRGLVRAVTEDARLILDGAQLLQDSAFCVDED